MTGTTTAVDLEPLPLTGCEACARLFWYPRAICSRCGQPTSPAPAILPGTVYSVTTVHVSPPDFRDEVPYEVALVHCARNISILARTYGLEIGAEVRVGQAHLGSHGLVPLAVRAPNDRP